MKEAPDELMGEVETEVIEKDGIIMHPAVQHEIMRCLSPRGRSTNLWAGYFGMGFGVYLVPDAA